MTKHKKTLRKVIALLLAFIMVGSIIPTMAFAATTEAEAKEDIEEHVSFIQSIVIEIRNFIQKVTDFVKKLFKLGDKEPEVISVEEIKIDKTEIKLIIGESDKIAVTVAPDNATDKGYTIVSSDEAVATVDAEGNITAIARGTATITVTANADATKQATVEVNVFDEVITTAWENFNDTYRGKDGSYILGNDFNPGNVIFFGNATTVTLDLNDKTVEAGNPGQYIFGSQNGSSLRLTGDGTVYAGKGVMTNKLGAEIIFDGGTYYFTQTGTLNDMKHCSVAQNDSKIVINDGKFFTDVEDACLFFATTNSIIEINGGFFENTADKTPDLLSMGTNKYTTQRIILKGGTFVNYNPLEDRMCYTGEKPYEQLGGPWMVVWEGNTVVAEEQENGDIWYSVVPESAVNA